MCSLESDLVPYTCTRCQHVTYAPPGNVAVTCGNCGIVDLGTELARQRWRTYAEIHMENRPQREESVARESHEPIAFSRTFRIVMGAMAVLWLAVLGWLVLR